MMVFYQNLQSISLQARKLKDSLCQISDGLQQWASKTLLVAGAYKKLANLITDTPTQFTETKVFCGMWKIPLVL